MDNFSLFLTLCIGVTDTWARKACALTFLFMKLIHNFLVNSQPMDSQWIIRQQRQNAMKPAGCACIKFNPRLDPMTLVIINAENLFSCNI